MATGLPVTSTLRELDLGDKRTGSLRCDPETNHHLKHTKPSQGSAGRILRDTFQGIQIHSAWKQLPCGYLVRVGLTAFRRRNIERCRNANKHTSCPPWDNCRALT